jgi:hypothetical protein
MAKVNETEAHLNGGKFFVRFDDDQQYWNDLRKVNAENIKKEVKKDLEWAGLEVDEYISEKEMIKSTDLLLKKFKYKNFNSSAYTLTHIYLPETPEGSSLVCDKALADKSFYPFVPDLTARKVINDSLNDVRLLIRGMDLITEFSLYNYYCMLWDLIIPRQVFLPKVKMLEEDGQTSGISKTLGGFTIKSFRERGVPVKEIWHMLADSCLINPEGSWTTYNIKINPYINKNKYKHIFEPRLSNKIINNTELKTSEEAENDVGYAGALIKKNDKSTTNL